MKIMRESVANTASLCALRARVSNGVTALARLDGMLPRAWHAASSDSACALSRRASAKAGRSLSAGCVRGATTRSPRPTGSSRAAAVALQRAALETGVIPGGNLRARRRERHVRRERRVSRRSGTQTTACRRFHKRRRDRAWCVFRHTARWHASVHASVAAAISARGATCQSKQPARKASRVNELAPRVRQPVQAAPEVTRSARRLART